MFIETTSFSPSSLEDKTSPESVLWTSTLVSLECLAAVLFVSSDLGLELGLFNPIESVDWRQYGLEQAGGKGVPKGPAAILVHLASTNVQFTSEAKEALSDNEFVFEETRKAMLEMGRGLRKHLEKKKKMAKTREKFELINDILPAIAEKSAAILERPVPDLSGSITRIMSAVICNETTGWNKETKLVDVSITLFNYTSRARSYSILVNWPEKAGAEFVGNDRGGRKEAMGIWGWKIETLEPGAKAVVEYSLSNLEKGDWTETEVFFRGSQDVIGATKLDEKMLDEIRKQELILNQTENATQSDDSDSTYDPGVVEGNSGQTTLFGGEN